ncbi:MAG: ATP-binding protein [Candidatus Xenobiia bacterium LiM19]
MGNDESRELKERVRQLEAELACSREKVDELERGCSYSRLLVEKALEGLAVCNIDKATLEITFSLWNDRMTELSGFTMADVNEKGVINCFFRDTRQKKKARQRIRTMINKKMFIRDEWFCQSKDGRTRVLSISPSIISENESSVDLLAIVADMTRIKEMNQQLFQAEKLSSIGKMISGIAHEINNPLTGIIGFSEILLAHSSLPENTRENLMLIYNESVRARKIVNDLLIFARRHSPEKKICAINDILADVISLTSCELERKCIKIDIYYERKIPLLVFGDRHQLHQVFMNIVNNAIDALLEMEGERRVRVRTDWVKNRVRVVIADNGHGMDQKTLDRIFDPFFTTKNAGEGTGLGLSISYGIVKEHRGKIYVKSTPGNGTRFSIELPLAGKENAGACNEAVAAGSDECVEEKESLSDRLEGKRVLVVDDEEIIRRLLSSFLKKSGIVVETAENGLEGLNKIRVGEYDLILSDFAMPEVDGKRIFEELSRTAPHLISRLVFMSGDVRDKARDFFEKNNVECLQKPFELAMLTELLERRL